MPLPAAGDENAVHAFRTRVMAVYGLGRQETGLRLTREHLPCQLNGWEKDPLLKLLVNAEYPLPEIPEGEEVQLYLLDGAAFARQSDAALLEPAGTEGEDALLRRIGEAYPNLEVKSKELAKKLKEQAEAMQESVEEKKQAVADAVAEGKLAAEAAAEERRLAAEERKQQVQEAVEEKKIAFEEKKQAVALAVSKVQQKRQSEEAFRARMKKAYQKKREEKIRKGNKK